MNTRDLSWDKGSRCPKLSNYHPHSAERQENPGFNLPGIPWTTSACCGMTFTFNSNNNNNKYYCICNEIATMAFIIFCSVLYRKEKGNFQIILCWLVDITEIENNEMGEACRTYGVKRGVCGVVVGKLEGKKTFERPRRRG